MRWVEEEGSGGGGGGGGPNQSGLTVTLKRNSRTNSVWNPFLWAGHTAVRRRNETSQKGAQHIKTNHMLQTWGPMPAQMGQFFIEPHGMSSGFFFVFRPWKRRSV